MLGLSLSLLIGPSAGRLPYSRARGGVGSIFGLPDAPDALVLNERARFSAKDCIYLILSGLGDSGATSLQSVFQPLSAVVEEKRSQSETV